MTRIRHVTDELPAYVLNSLEDDERQSVAAHLSMCDACRTEHERLAALPALLDLVQPRRLALASQPPTYLEDVVVARLVNAREAGRRSSGDGLPWLRKRWHLAGVGLTGVLAGVAVTLAINGLLTGGTAPERIRLDATDGSDARADATLHRSVANTRIAVRVEGLAPTVGDDVYEVWLVNEAGRVSAGTFTVADRGGGAVELELNAAGPVTRYDRIGITREPDAADPAANGRNVLAAPLAAS